jgi:hypothetical protein
VLAVAAGELEHGVVERVEARQGDELERVAELAQALLEGGDLVVVELALPVEGGRAVVGQQLARVGLVEGLGEVLGLVEVGLGGLAPDEVAVGRVGDPARDRLLDAGVGACARPAASR